MSQYVARSDAQAGHIPPVNCLQAAFPIRPCLDDSDPLSSKERQELHRPPVDNEGAGA
jgi:hypothetical protein